MPGLDPRHIAESMAESTATYVMIAADQERDGVLQACVVAFQEVLADIGISASANDVAYYLKLVGAAVDDMKRREVKEPVKVSRH
jgi:hypothetical protein